jgi:uncharacterized protein (DUF924 family)
MTRFLAAVLAAAVLGCGAAAAAQPVEFKRDRFRTEYVQPDDPSHRALYVALKDARVLEKFRAFLSFIRLPRTLTLRLTGCDGDDNAWYDADERAVTVCYEYLAHLRRIAPPAPTPAGVTPENAFTGPLLEVFLHEIAHALFDQLRLPILGREEDAADQLAALILLHLEPRAARDTVAGVAWMYAVDARQAKVGEAAYANVHSLDAQRFYNLLCLAYGAEPALFADVVSNKLLPADRAEGCRDEYRQVAYAVRTLMRPYIDLPQRDQMLAREWAGGKMRRRLAGDARPR